MVNGGTLPARMLRSSVTATASTTIITGTSSVRRTDAWMNGVVLGALAALESIVWCGLVWWVALLYGTRSYYLPIDP